MTDLPPFDPTRTFAENVSESMGVTISYAHRIIRQHGYESEAEVHDARRKALLVESETQVLADLDEVDIEDLAAAEDPKAEMKDMVMDRAARRMRAQIAANTRWAHTDQDDRARQTERARAAMDTRFDNEVDPDRILDPAERARRAGYARKAYFTRLAYKSAKARRLKMASRQGS